MSSPRLSVCLSVDFDAMSVWIGLLQSNSLTHMSRGEFGAYALPRVLELLAKHEILASFYIPGHTALAYPDLVRRIRDEGHEIGHHGWVHEAGTLDEAEERTVIERGLEALGSVAGITPVGHRTTGRPYTPITLDLLLEYGFSYDHSFNATDFYPYYLRTGDRWSTTEPYEFGEPSELIAAPFQWAVDDFPLFEFTSWSVVQKSPAEVGAMWQDEFDYALANCPGGYFDITTHPQVIGRGSRLMMLEGLIEYMKGMSGVCFERTCDYIERWRRENPLAEWKDQRAGEPERRA